MAANDIAQRDETLPIEGVQRTEFDFGDFDHSKIPFEENEIPVIVIGSSMIGMSLQLFLGFHGSAIRQRAALFQLRTIEIFRQLGLEEAFREESKTVIDLDGGMLLTDVSYQGKELAIVQGSDPKKIAEISPCVRFWLTQDMYEPWVRERATILQDPRRALRGKGRPRGGSGPRYRDGQVPQVQDPVFGRLRW
ncbi:uncharacterized protein Z518_00722 [Rhinocladiella mackenziei CBS 650.93]|uniref:Uncharacterized protein n=1 Tax=Rhinocladiella mackenziei CBS 650.93 TaxID=1442369 RepID=A0A0D2J1S4_9EURO|nr:uncharacterized protein Z518_00722 [Rhinocladiella mackenziei CBS 650.93]KIX09641.1 hypothetical protein Z518_00722 [Rhinocladiella mackenziei CBS 650.93]